MGRKDFWPARRSPRDWWRPYGSIWSYRAGEKYARSSGAIGSPSDLSRSIAAAMSTVLRAITALVTRFRQLAWLGRMNNVLATWPYSCWARVRAF
jgi:hypothetical protein